MNRLERTFNLLREKRDGAYIAYVCAGDPDPDFTVEQVQRLADAGADVVELGIPFSDPIADGPVIQAAMNRALSGGISVGSVFHSARSLRDMGIDIPLVAMTYYNPVLRQGEEAFCEAAAEAGLDALLVVDLPLEESERMESAARGYGLDMIKLVAPTTTIQRLDEVLARASGFLYAVSTAGTTGARHELPASAGALLSKVVPRTRLPVALGFGISSPSHVKDALSMGASGVVEGSRLISTYSDLLPDKHRALEAVFLHAKEMKLATVGGLSRRS